MLTGTRASPSPAEHHSRSFDSLFDSLEPGNTLGSSHPELESSRIHHDLLAHAPVEGIELELAAKCSSLLVELA